MRLSRRSWILLSCFGAVLYFSALGSNRVLTLHEALFAQAAKESVLSGNWITTTYGGAYFNHKPPLTNWLMAALFTLFGSPSEFVLRAPFAMAAIATALIVACLAARWHGDWVGRLAGCLQLTAYYSLMQGRLAESDILLCLFVTAAIGSFAAARIADGAGQSPPQRQQRLGILGFYIFAGLAFLSKGPIGLVFTFAPTILWMVLQRDWMAWRLCLRPAPLLVFGVLVCGWPYLAWRADPNIFETWRYHNLGRFVGEMGGRKPPFFYTYTVPFMLLPWTPFVIGGLWLGWKQGLGRDPLLQLVGLTFACGFGVLSAAVWQYKHYLVPILPGLSLFGAHGLDAFLRKGVRWSDATASELAAPPSIRQCRLAAWGIASIGAAALLVEVVLLPQHDSYRDQTQFAKEVNDRLNADEKLFLVDLIENQITYYLRMPLERVDDPKAFAALVGSMPPGKAVHVIGPEKLATELAEVGSLEKVAACPTIRAIMRPDERITHFRVTRWASAGTKNPELR